MNTSIFFIASITAGMGIVASFNLNPSEIEINLNDAIQKGFIQCKSTSSGGFSGKCVSLSLRNNTLSSYKIKIPMGTLFHPDDSGQQTLITLDQQFISLNPSVTITEGISVYCSEHSDRSPNMSTNFTIGNNKNPKFDSLFTFLKNKSVSSSQQAIVWAISDNSPVSSISSDSKILREIRSFLFKITGQEEVSYSVDMLTFSDEDGFISETPIQLKGFIVFTSEKRKWIHQEVYDENGKLKFKSEQAFEIPKGESDYSFNIGLKNWKKGSYTLKLKEGSEVVELYKFKV